MRKFFLGIDGHVDDADTWIPYPRYLLRKNLVKRILSGEQGAGRKCLEIGYGSGDMLLLYAGMGFSVYAYDYSEAALANARGRLSKHQHLAKHITLYESEPEMETRKYDYLMAFEVLEHIEEDAAALKNWISFVEDGGKILLSVPAHKRKWGSSDVAVGHYRRYEKSDVLEMCGQCGIAIQYLWSYGFPLTILLDKLLHASKKTEVKDTGILSRDDLSKKSGVNRNKNALYRLIFNDVLLSPFYLLQSLFLQTDLGSGYIVAGVIRRNK